LLVLPALLFVVPGIELKPAFDEYQAAFLQILAKRFSGGPGNVDKQRLLPRFPPLSTWFCWQSWRVAARGWRWFKEE